MAWNRQMDPLTVPFTGVVCALTGFIFVSVLIIILLGLMNAYMAGT